MREDRPMPAERLIREAIDIYKERNDPHGLGNAYRDYGDLLRSPAVAKHEIAYRRDGFQDRSVTFDNRFSKASEFTSKALEYYRLAEKQDRESAKFDALTNVYFNMAWCYYTLDDREKACGFYDRTLEAYTENIRRNPTAKPNVPSGFGSVADVVASEKQRAACK
jgi:tetratricopeptide (TPR) repeat protein